MESEVLNILTKAGELVILCLVIWQMSRNQGQSNNAVAALAGALGKLTEALENLKKSEDETQTLVTGARREDQAAHTAQAEALGAIQSAIAGIPDKTYEKLSPDLGTIRLQLEQAREALGSACSKLDQLTKAPEPGESADKATPERATEASGGANIPLVEVKA